MKKREIVLYLIFGVLTTVISLLSFKLFNFLFGEELYLLNNIFSWFIAVAFAFITNKIFVFESKKWESPMIFKEIFLFVSARVFSLILEEAGLFLLIDILAILSPDFSKLIMQIMVIILNFVFSKFIVFKKSLNF